MTVEEAEDVQDVRIAKYYGGVSPDQVRYEWSWKSISNTLQVMEADQEIRAIKAKLGRT